ncbi:MAG TPA: PAS domain S-box protein [Verrucomicrobiae bacterium]|nr:PAS domain S-box protein [Verrucomicrobiae bacterium]
MDSDFLKRTFRILHLEDNESDRLFVREILESNQFSAEIKAVKTREEFQAALETGKYDLILSDYTLPSFDGMSALALARKLCPEIPFIFFSGTIGEEVAIESLKNGAVDYVLKQRPNRLVPAIRRAVRNSEERIRLKQTENALRQSEERFGIVLRASNDVVWEWDIRSNTIWFSPNFETVFGYTLGSIGTRIESWQALIHPDDRPRVLEGISKCLAVGGKAWWSEHRVRRADGSYAYIFDRTSLVLDSNAQPMRLIGVSIDVTERKEAEMKIREQAALLDKASDAIILCNINLKIAYWNMGAERIYGWSAAEAIGTNISELLLRGSHPPQIPELIQRIDEYGEWVGELQEFTKDGRTIITQVRITLIRDEQNNPKSLLIINTDITERKQLEQQFLRAQRLESLGVLIGGIAHDLNNALSPVLMGVNLLSEQLKSNEAAPILQMMEASARRGADMVKQVLTFARGGDTGRTTLQMEQLAKEMCKIVTDVFPKNIECRLNTEKGLWPVSAIPTQMHQVLMNLCVNARDAMPNGGSLTVTVKNVTLDAAEASLYPEGKPGRYLCTSVGDTGTGMTPEQLGKLFQPFFTTKAPGKGTGLGLSTSRNIIRNHQGFMTVQSEPGRGTEFKFFLPASGVEDVQGAPAERLPLPGGQGESILVVDDEEAALAIMRTTLENYGFKVFTATSGQEALAMLDRELGVVHLIVTDLMMPFMDGRQTVEALRKILPDIPIIAISGLDQEKNNELERDISAAAFIQKPFTADCFITAVSKALKNLSEK